MLGIRLGLGIAGAQTAANRLRQYTVDGIAPSLVLDFTVATYGANTDASLAKYGGASLVLDFREGQYAADDMASLAKYSVNGQSPGLLLDFTEAQYGRQS